MSRQSALPVTPSARKLTERGKKSDKLAGVLQNRARSEEAELQIAGARRMAENDGREQAVEAEQVEGHCTERGEMRAAWR